MITKFGIKIGLLLWVITAILIFVFSSGQEIHDPHAIDIWGIAQKAFNILLLLDILIYFAGGNLKNFFSSRQQQIQDELKESKDSRIEFEEKLKAMRKKLDNLDKELEAIINKARKEAEEEKGRLITAAKAESEKMIEMTKREIEIEYEQANKNLRTRIADLALAKSEEILKKEVDEKDHKKLVEMFIEQIQEADK